MVLKKRKNRKRRLSYFPDDFGGYLHVSGLTFDADLNKDAGVEKVDTDKLLIDTDVLEAYFDSFEGNVPQEYKESQERIHYVD